MVTVIIPTYNNQDTIQRAIDSVISQTVDDWRIIVVDDRSSDDTPQILTSYNQRFPNKIKIITNSINLGVGKSRKYGFSYVDTEFVTFLDSDDMLTKDYIQMSLMLQSQHDSDIVYSSFSIMYPNGKIEVKNYGDYIMTGKATPQPYFSEELKFFTGKLFKTSVLKQIRFSPKRIGEDTQTLFFALYKAEKVRSSSYSGYIHICRQESLLSNKVYFYRWTNSTIVDQEIMDFLIENDDMELLSPILLKAYNEYISTKRMKDMPEYIPHDDVVDNWKYWVKVSNWFEARRAYFPRCGISEPEKTLFVTDNL